ncbi:hypothetical protein M408DRAFT_331100 [Serendipita vermifera MAFF 305830]|uniref:GATA-type domain-containing protein n=1 Tax=Serendipita vermifera MAFF 305830 TaxID=933852 RepID=A0A0C2X8H9_SERVB|nr:hypothetical protein M408DRAFT_331100 [Serendipita vermifera MAFF 305830]
MSADHPVSSTGHPESSVGSSSATAVPSLYRTPPTLPKSPSSDPLYRRASLPFVHRNPSMSEFATKYAQNDQQQLIPEARHHAAQHRYEPGYEDQVDSDDRRLLFRSPMIVPTQQVLPQTHPLYRPYLSSSVPSVSIPTSTLFNLAISSIPITYTDDAASKETQYLRRKCFNCENTEPLSWRRSTLNPGKIVCNKCGLYERTHNKPRPRPHHTSSSITGTNPYYMDYAPSFSGGSAVHATLLPHGTSDSNPLKRSRSPISEDTGDIRHKKRLKKSDRSIASTSKQPSGSREVAKQHSRPLAKRRRTKRKDRNAHNDIKDPDNQQTQIEADEEGSGSGSGELSYAESRGSTNSLVKYGSDSDSHLSDSFRPTPAAYMARSSSQSSLDRIFASVERSISSRQSRSRSTSLSLR